MKIRSKEKRLIKKFLEAYKKIINEQTKEKFNPRHLAIISQPNLKKSDTLEWIAYHKWFDEVDIGVSHCRSNNLIAAFLEIPIHVLIQAEELGKPLLSVKDQKKLSKALKILNEIKVGIKWKKYHSKTYMYVKNVIRKLLDIQ